MANFYHIYLDSKPGITKEEIKGKMDLALDWFKYDSKNWVIYTTSDAKKWYGRLENLFRPNGNCFISKLNIDDYYGWMSKDFWGWIKETPNK